MGKGRSQLIADNRLLFDQLRRLHTGGVAMVAATWPTPRGAEYSRTDLLVPNHAYTLLDYDEATHIVSLRNPWEITLILMAFSHSHLRPFFGLMSFTPTPNDRPSRDLRGALAAYLGQQRTSAFVCRNLR